MTMTNVEAFAFAKKNPNKRGEVIHCIDNPYWARIWLERFPEDKEKLIHFYQPVHDAGSALVFASRFPEDKDKVIQFVDKSYWVYHWLEEFPEDENYFIEKGLLV